MNQANNHPTSAKDSLWICFQGSWADRLLLALLMAGILWLWFFIQHSLNVGEPTAYVYHQDQLLAKYPLPRDGQVIHVPAAGEIGTSDIEISKQGIRFVSSPCTTHYCMLSGHKNHAGAVIACVPNHIMVVLRGSFDRQQDEQMFDAVTE